MTAMSFIHCRSGHKGGVSKKQGHDAHVSNSRPNMVHTLQTLDMMVMAVSTSKKKRRSTAEEHNVTVYLEPKTPCTR